jgi:phage replication O-like protein O
MSEKLRPNFTPVPNVILDEIMRGLNDGEFKTLMAICRYTYGWGKKSDRISLSQLGEITGIVDRSNVHRAIKRLGNLIDITPGNPSKNLASEYRINVDIADDLLSQKQQELLSERQHPVVRPVVSSATIQRKPKKEEYTGAKAPDSLPTKSKRKQRRAASIPPDLQLTVSRVVAKINELGGTHYQDDRPDALHNLIARLNDGRTEAECLAVVESRHAAWTGNNKMLEYFRPSTLFASAHFEDYLQAAQRQGNGNGHAPSKVEFLDNGTIKVDGFTMSRADYERRNAKRQRDTQVH